MSRRVTLGELQSLLVDIHSDNFFRTQSLRDGHDEQTDGPGTEYDDVLPRLELSERGDRVHSDREGLHHGAIFQGY